MTSTAIKIIALVLMLFDHVAQFLPNMPLLFHLLGRISAPLFFFMMAWGLQYTHDKKKYLLRLYIFGIVMAILSSALMLIAENPRTPILNNIFVTLLLVGIIVTISDKIKSKQPSGGKLLAGFILIQFISIALCIITLYLPFYYKNFIYALLPNILFNEGGYIFVALGVIFYYTKNKKRLLTIGYSCFCLVLFLLACSNGLYTIRMMEIAGQKLTMLSYLTTHDYQWMMIGALPIMLTYNGKKGTGLKYLFYIFYPLHIAILYLIGTLFF